jgi:hypothetical protein
MHEMVTLTQAHELARTYAILGLRQLTTHGDGWPDICGPVWLIPKDEYAAFEAEMTARFGEPQFEGLASWDELAAQPPAGVIVKRAMDD